jgi:predicted unusual protein kinase regulating ubiquinone biosynthesis (AarF/ABC1/UbiB family)
MKLTGSYLGYQLQNLWLDKEHREEHRRRFQRNASRQIREELQTLKGPVMKLGQMLSTQSSLLTPEALDELAALQMHAPGMHPTLARAQFKSSLGREPDEVFREFEPEPFAAASLGQVHRAITQTGEIVAVKIQYPGIRKAVENDFKLLRSAAIAGRISGHIPKTLLDEIETRIVLETDYLQEGRNLDAFREHLKPLPHVHVPRVWGDLTTDRVLTMSCLEGKHLGDWLARNPSAALRNLVGSRLFELFYFQVLRVGMLHADPHPGNYLFSESGEIGLVDFGCVKEVAPAFSAVIRIFINPEWLPEPQRVAQMARLIWGEQPPGKHQHSCRIIKSAFEFGRRVFPRATATSAVVDFGNDAVFDGMARVAKELLQNKLIRPEFVFVKRAEIGLYNVLHQLGAKIRTGDLVNRIAKGDIWF